MENIKLFRIIDKLGISRKKALLLITEKNLTCYIDKGLYVGCRVTTHTLENLIISDSDTFEDDVITPNGSKRPAYTPYSTDSIYIKYCGFEKLREDGSSSISSKVNKEISTIEEILISGNIEINGDIYSFSGVSKAFITSILLFLKGDPFKEFRKKDIYDIARDQAKKIDEGVNKTDSLPARFVNNVRVNGEVVDVFDDEEKRLFIRKPNNRYQIIDELKVYCS